MGIGEQSVMFCEIGVIFEEFEVGFHVYIG